MKRWLLGASALAALCLGVPAHAATWPGQCPGGTDPRAIGCMLQAVPPADTDLLSGWQIGQTQHTRAFQWLQLRNGGQDIGLQTVKPAGSVTARSLAARFGDKIYARDFGVVADGTTSDDQALGLAIYACGQLTQGGHLELPQRGTIRLTGVALTGNATRLIHDCAIVGPGVPDPKNVGAQTFTIESASVSPFQLGFNFGFEGASFYWPGQHGAQFFPPLFTDNGASGAAHGYFHNLSIVNAYDGVAATVNWGDIKFSNVMTFAAHDNFRFVQTGDGMMFSNVRVLPGAWLSMCGSCDAQVGLASSTAIALHIGSGGDVSVNASNLVVVGARYGVLLDAGARLTESEIDGAFDVVGTIVDTSAAGAFWSAGSKFTGISAGCATPAVVWGGANTGNAPCFNLGTAQSFTLTDFHSGGSQGDFIATAGADVAVIASESFSIGSANDGGDYHQLRISGTNTPSIRVQNSRFAGAASSAHTHGITSTGSGVPASLMIQGNFFQYLNDDINVLPPVGAVISGNMSFETHAAGGLKSVNLQNNNAVVYANNYFDAPSTPVISACGGSPTISAGHGPTSGFFTTGTGSVLTCVFTVPFSTFGKCTFQPANAITIGAGPSGVPNAWTLTFYLGAAPVSSPSMNIFYSCPGQQ